MLARYGVLRPLAVASRPGLFRFLAVTAARHFGGRRWYSSEIEDLKRATDSGEVDNSAEVTGVIDLQKQREILVYFNDRYPLMLSNSFVKQVVKMVWACFRGPFDDKTQETKLWEISNTPEKPLPEGTKILQFIPFKRDGGAFAKFNVPPGTNNDELLGMIQSNIKTNEDRDAKGIWGRMNALFWAKSPSSFPVKGTPWIEDLRRIPSTQLKVKFEGESLTEEELFLLFRRYGTIQEIVPFSSSDGHAKVIFTRVRAAISAKNCLTGLSVNKGKSILHIQFIPVNKVSWIKDAIVNHQRISVPVILALLATFAVLIFDPIREFFVESKITHRYSLSTYKDTVVVRLVSWPYYAVRNWLDEGYDYIEKKVEQQLGLDCEDKEALKAVSSMPIVEERSSLWNERDEKSKQLKLWILENINTFIVVRGPKGAGKEEFVLDHTLLSDDELKNRILYINCDVLVKSRSDNALLKNTASQLGYFPLFTWTNNISQFIDLGLQGLTGQKSGLSESKETQLKNMFLLTTQAIRNINNKEYKRYKSAVERSQKRQKRQTTTPLVAIDTDASAEGIKTPELDVSREDVFLQEHPEVKPIIVINRFHGKTANKDNDYVYDMISEWSALLIQGNLAHVIFITSDIGSVLRLNASLPNNVFKMVTLSDASSTSAKLYVMNQLQGNVVNPDIIESCVGPLGGRMLDLQAYVRRLNSGESPDVALDEMISQAAEQVTTFFLNANQEVNPDNSWSTSQVWYLIKRLSEKSSIEFGELLASPFFKNPNKTIATLSALEKFDLITLERDKGVLVRINIGRPIFKSAFTSLVGDVGLYKLYESEFITNLIAFENAKVTKFEDELVKLRGFSNFNNRINYLKDKLDLSTEKLLELEKKSKDVLAMKPEPPKQESSKFSLKLF